MGIYYRYAGAFLALFIIAFDATATVRVSAKSKAKDIISKPLESGFSLPNGAEAYYGRDKMFEIDNRLNASAGSSVGPTVRPVPASTVGNVSFPYGPNAAYPNGSGVPNPVLKVREKVKVPKTNIFKALKNGLKTSPAQIAVTATVAAALAGVGYVMDPANNTIQKKQSSYDGKPLNGSYTTTTQAKPSVCNSVPSETMSGGVTVTNSLGRLYYNVVIPAPSGSVDTTKFVNNCTNSSMGYKPTAGKYPVEYSTLISESDITVSNVPVSDSDLDLLNPWVAGQSAEWLGGLIRDICNGSPNPNGCFEDMKEGGGFEISGPTSVQGPSTTKTTTSQNPDGSTSTRTDTSSTNYSVTYNNNNNTFDVDTKITNTTTVDGQVTETSEQTDDTPAVDLPPEEETPEETYTFDDAEFPTVKPFYDVKYPDGLQGVWQSISAQIDQSAFIEFLKGFVPSFSGSCPAFGLSFNISSWANYGTIQFSSVCYVLDFVKIIILVTAIFTFRKVVFGG